jgi:hypothetical protein
MKLTGRCHCGDLTYEIDDKKAVRLPDCTCKDCQRATGALTVPYVSVNPAHFRVIGGTAKVFKATDGDGCDRNGKWLLCDTCGSRVVWMEDAGRFYTVLTGTISERDAVAALPFFDPSEG